MISSKGERGVERMNSTGTLIQTTTTQVPQRIHVLLAWTLTGCETRRTFSRKGTALEQFWAPKQRMRIHPQASYRCLRKYFYSSARSHAFNNSEGTYL